MPTRPIFTPRGDELAAAEAPVPPFEERPPHQDGPKLPDEPPTAPLPEPVPPPVTESKSSDAAPQRLTLSNPGKTPRRSWVFSLLGSDGRSPGSATSGRVLEVERPQAADRTARR